MKKIIFYFLMLALYLLTPAAEKTVFPIPEAVKPTQIVVGDNFICIPEGETIRLFSLKPFAYIKSVGKKGEGPGEFMQEPFVLFHDGEWLVNDASKFLHLSPSGEFKKEDKFPFHYFLNYPIIPVLRNVVCFQLRMNRETRRPEFAGKIYDGDFRLLREFYEGGEPLILPPPPPNARPAGKTERKVIGHMVDFAVEEGKIFVADSRKGFYIAVFGSGGDLQCEIRHDTVKKPVSQKFKDDAMKRIREEPNWETRRRAFNYVFPEYFPDFFTFTVRDGKIYVAGYEEQNNNHELIIMDLQGKIIKRSFTFPLSPFSGAGGPFVPFSINYAIKDNRIYYLVENSEKECWEIHSEEL